MGKIKLNTISSLSNGIINVMFSMFFAEHFPNNIAASDRWASRLRVLCCWEYAVALLMPHALLEFILCLCFLWLLFVLLQGAPKSHLLALEVPLLKDSLAVNHYSPGVS